MVMGILVIWGCLGGLAVFGRVSEGEIVGEEGG